VFGIAATGFAALSFLVPLGVVALYYPHNTSQPPADQTDPLVALLALLASFYLAGLGASVAAVCGIITGLVGLGRREGAGWLSVIGLLMGVAVLALAAPAYLRTTAN
jgi:hypothetical protein